MKILLGVIWIVFPLFVWAKIDESYASQIENAKTPEDKEQIYLEWVTNLSQTNTLGCDSLIRKNDRHLLELSNDGKIALLVTLFNNSRLGGLNTPPEVDRYHLNEADGLLIEGIIKCFKNEEISKEEYDKIKLKAVNFMTPPVKVSFMPFQHA